MKRFLVSLILLLGVVHVGTAANYQKLWRHWKGVKMFQDENSYDGKTFFLPNEVEMILSPNKAHLYYYPYFKSAEFNVRYSNKTIYYRINGRDIRCNYRFNADTLVFEMFYINKTFVKLFVPTELDMDILNELDTYGFKTDKVVFEFELDTLHPDERIGFRHYDSLNFKPFQHLRFIEDGTLELDRKHRVSYRKGFKTLNFYFKGKPQQFEISHLSGTQSVFFIPRSQCRCDSIILPYLTVQWADRIRQAIIDEENF